jgi:rod shape determining protein RodA
VSNRDRFSNLLIMGVALNFFLFFSVNMSMVMGLAPVVGVPLPLISYGGTSAVTLLAGFGMMMSIYGHRKFIR